MKKKILVLMLFLTAIYSYAQEYDYKFRLLLKDKGETQYSTDKPQDFLSPKAIERREKQGLKVSISDLPISNNYIKVVEDLGVVVVAKSKWLKTISVHCTDSATVEELKALPFVHDAVFVWKGRRKYSLKAPLPDSLFFANRQKVTFGNDYGYSVDNIKSLNGKSIHDAGFKGQGMEIAVIDAGFNHLSRIELLDNINIKGHKGFVYQNEDLFNSYNEHGLNVLSCIATNKPMQFIGTAPEASYWLLGTEDSRSEFPIEEDYWITAIEYADSVGVDVVNTSLGYSKFDAPAKSWTHKDLNGQTTSISRAANMAAQKGMFVVCSAGNSGDSEWRKITTPSDANLVLTVGSIQRDSVISSFSSRGLTADLRIKPDVMALGSASAVVDQMGLISYKSGTSFSSPIMTGMVACLWQAFPSLTNRELLQIIKESGNRYDNPNEDYGYGIPDIGKAMELAQMYIDSKGVNKIAASDYFRIESDGIGQLRIVVLSNTPQQEYKILLTKKVKGVEKRILSDTFTDAKYTYTIKKAKEKDVYNLTISGADIEDKLQIYF